MRTLRLSRLPFVCEKAEPTGGGTGADFPGSHDFGKLRTGKEWRQAMFVNGDAIGFVIKVLIASLMLLCLTLVSHLIWISSLVRSRALDRFGSAGRIAILALAAATPVVSFYCVGIVRYLSCHALRPNPAGVGKTMLSVVGAFVMATLWLLVVVQLGPHGSNWLSRVAGIILFSVVPCAVLGMACQVLVRSNQARAGLIVVAGSTALCLFLLA